MTETATSTLVNVLPILMIGFALGRNRAKEHFSDALLLTFFISIFATALTEVVLIAYLFSHGAAPIWMGVPATICSIFMLGFMAFFGFANMGGGEIQRRKNRKRNE